MTELEKLVEATIELYREGETLSAENATVMANDMKAAMQDHEYSVEDQAMYFGRLVEVLMNDPTTQGSRNEVIRALGDGFGFDVSVTVLPDNERFEMALKVRPIQ